MSRSADLRTVGTLCLKAAAVVAAAASGGPAGDNDSVWWYGLITIDRPN